MKKIIALLLILITFSTVLSTVALAAGFGSGVEVVADGVTVIKTGISGRKITFSETDFKQALCISEFDKITITSLPASTEGTLMLAGRRVAVGATI